MNMKFDMDDLRINWTEVVTSPASLLEELPLSKNAAWTVESTRKDIKGILEGGDDRLMVVVGPCSIHDPEAAREYAQRLRKVRERLADDLLVIMRVYFEKPRTTVGWKGLLNDPYLDSSFKINDGLRIGRKLLRDLAEMGVPAGTEFLDLMTPQYYTDLVSWGAIGARTTESQVHRELASGLSCPIGFKNGTSGNLQIAIEAIVSAAHPHCFLGHTKQGQSAIFTTRGNPDCHIILRGGRGTTNYDAEHVQKVSEQMEKAGLKARVMIDCSHANSHKDYTKQPMVCRNVATQLAGGDRRIQGIMIESHLLAGRQDIQPGKPLQYGQSITDSCIAWEETEGLLEELAEAVRSRRT
jgi:3-deoxy-7-phosphoheptulonate synthase